MIIILKIILSLFIILAIYVARLFYKDFKLAEKSQSFEECTIADKLKIKIMLYVSLITITSFCLLLLWYIIIPIQMSI